MNPQYVLCGVIAAGILIYLAIALLKPELFS
ncbi:MAG: potassium ABC transporter ATPase [Candidatus Solibacter sp.]|nr:potassium ABC transporter ATPase [Candidatus Solibacter sp.]